MLYFPFVLLPAQAVWACKCSFLVGARDGFWPLHLRPYLSLRLATGLMAAGGWKRMNRLFQWT